MKYPLVLNPGESYSCAGFASLSQRSGRRCENVVRRKPEGRGLAGLPSGLGGEQWEIHHHLRPFLPTARGDELSQVEGGECWSFDVAS